MKLVKGGWTNYNKKTWKRIVLIVVFSVFFSLMCACLLQLSWTLTQISVRGSKYWTGCGNNEEINVFCRESSHSKSR